jgi:hypothetical protein
MRLKTQRVRMVPPIPHTIIVTPNVKLSMAFTPQNDYEFSGSRLYLIEFAGRCNMIPGFMHTISELHGFHPRFSALYANRFCSLHPDSVHFMNPGPQGQVRDRKIINSKHGIRNPGNK